MRTNPLSAPEHEDLEWREFVTKPLTTEQPASDINMKKVDNMCQWEFLYDEVVPCLTTLEDDDVCELKWDGSGRPFDSIVNLRAEKIKNFFSAEDYSHVQEVIPAKYEDLMEQGGFETLIEQVQFLYHIPSKCSSTKYVTLKPPRNAAVYLEDYEGWLDAKSKTSVYELFFDATFNELF